MSDNTKNSAASAAVPDDTVNAAGARAKPLAVRLPAVHAEEGSTSTMALIPARITNEVLYCERLLYLEYVQGEWPTT